MSTCFILSTGFVSKRTTANADYCIARYCTSSGAIQNGAAVAGGAAWLGDKLGGKINEICRRPVGIIVGAGLGEM